MELCVNPFLSVLLLGPCCTQANQSTKKDAQLYGAAKSAVYFRPSLDLETNEILLQVFAQGLLLFFFNFLVWLFF